MTHVAVSQGGLFHDAQNGRSERFKRVTVKKIVKQTIYPLFCSSQNGRTSIRSLYEQLPEPTGISTNPLVEAFGLILPTMNIRLRLNRSQLRMSTDSPRINVRLDRGNAEHSWGFCIEQNVLKTSLHKAKGLCACMPR